MAEQPGIRQGQNKEAEPDDPMELVMTPVPGGDPELMVTCLVEEYAHLGMGEEEILRLFRQPVYATHTFYREYGEKWIRSLIRKVLARSGRLCVSVEVRHHSGGGDA